jgi:hypothetical protein
MKTNKNTKYFTLHNCPGDRSSTSVWNRFNGCKGTFIFDIFQYFKAENEKLQIVYANIRV